MYAQTAYIGSHEFVGRAAELEEISNWAKPANQKPVLLFEAIGGNGKSMLTWHWLKNHAQQAQTWAGIFWYSFYERGADMKDFCRHALAYIQQQPLANYQKLSTLQLTDILLPLLNTQPYLFVLDGLERILVAYHNINAAQMLDEEANNPKDIMGDREVCAAIKPNDDDLLRKLCGSQKSKILISSRLTPNVFINRTNNAIPSVERTILKGLKPSDAELMFVKVCSVFGNSENIQNYLTQKADCHPLVIGVLAGIISNYLPAPNNFDVWHKAPDGADKLNLANEDLIQNRNNIITVAINGLTNESKQLLHTLSLLADAADYEMLKAFNPYLPPQPKRVEEPFFFFNKEEKKEYEQYLKELETWKTSDEYNSASQKLPELVKDLKKRGLLQHDRANAPKVDIV